MDFLRCQLRQNINLTISFCVQQVNVGHGLLWGSFQGERESALRAKGGGGGGAVRMEGNFKKLIV